MLNILLSRVLIVFENFKMGRLVLRLILVRYNENFENFGHSPSVVED